MHTTIPVFCDSWSLLSPLRDAQATGNWRVVKPQWSKALSALPVDGPVRALVGWGANVLVLGDQQLALVAPNGERLWQRPRQRHTPVAVHANALTLKNPALWLETIDAAQQAQRAAVVLPGATTENVAVLSLWPREADFVAVVYDAAEVEGYDASDRGPRHNTPNLMVVRNRWGGTFGDWTLSFAARPRLQPLWLESLGLVVLLTDDVKVIDVEQECLVANFVLPLDQAQAWSATAKGLLVIVGEQSGRVVAVCVDTGGAQHWRWHASPGFVALADQPPVWTRDGAMVVASRTQVFKLAAGEVCWQHSIEGGTLQSVQALADGTLLLTCTDRLLWLNPNGATMATVALAPTDAPVCPPLVGVDGNVTLATVNTLLRLAP